MSLADRLWYDEGGTARAARALLRPLSALFGAAVAKRNAHFDARMLPPMALPALSVGNLTVGGTGKTPVAAWCSARLRSFGAKPAIVLRGYGDDEWRVHTLLNPHIPVVISPDRVGGALTARSLGADLVVLDDAFQHRRAARVVDLVLVSADTWTGSARLLPAGPFREPLSALTRASVVAITVKSASRAQVDQLSAAIMRAAPGVPLAVLRLQFGALCDAAGIAASDAQSPDRAAESLPTSWLSHRSIVVATAIGNPAAFERGLRANGAQIRRALRFADHHAFSRNDAARIARTAEGTDGVVCTLKDAVKLQAVWPREAPPLWYVSQTVVVDQGAEALDRAFARALAARTATVLTAG